MADLVFVLVMVLFFGAGSLLGASRHLLGLAEKWIVRARPRDRRAVGRRVGDAGAHRA